MAKAIDRAGMFVRRILIATVALGIGCGAAGQTSPEYAAARDVVSRLRDALIDAAALPGVDARFAALRDAVSVTHDLAYIAQFAVRRQWSDFSAEERAEYVDRFADLSIVTYAARFSGVTEDSWIVREVAAIDGGRVQVGTEVTRGDGSVVAIEYVLQQSERAELDGDAQAGDGNWRIVNIVADGVSDLALRRAEYRALLESGGVDHLLEELERQKEALLEGSDG